MICWLSKMITKYCLHQWLPRLQLFFPSVRHAACYCWYVISLRNTWSTPKFFFKFPVAIPGNSTAFIPWTKRLKPILYLSSTLIFIHVLHLSQQNLTKSHICSTQLNNHKPWLFVTKNLWTINFCCLFINNQFCVRANHPIIRSLIFQYC